MVPGYIPLQQLVIIQSSYVTLKLGGGMRSSKGVEDEASRAR